MPDRYAEHFPGPLHQPPVVSNVDAIQPHEHDEYPHHPKLQHHFDDMAQQTEASTLGMWVFLVTEVMFFGGLFLAYLVYRHADPMGFQEASNHLNVTWGAVNTIVLIVSSLTMALGVRAAQTSAPPRVQVGWVIATMILGSAFLGVKVIEYADKFEHHLVPGPNFVWEGQRKPVSGGTGPVSGSLQGQDRRFSEACRPPIPGSDSRTSSTRTLSAATRTRSPRRPTSSASSSARA